MKYVTGDLIKLAEAGEFDVIAHGCNCFHIMGAGIAKQIKNAFPSVTRADKTTLKGDRAKLGTCSVGKEGALTIINCYIQHSIYGPLPRVRYDAVRSCMKWIAENYDGQRIGLPAIGAGLAGGNFSDIEKIIKEELGNQDVTMVKYG